MDSYEEDLKSQGFNVIYLQHKRESRTEDNLNFILGKGFNCFITYEAFDWSLEKRIKDFSMKKKYKVGNKKK